MTRQEAEKIKEKARELLSWRSLSSIDYRPSPPSLLFDNLEFSKYIDSLVGEDIKEQPKKIKPLTSFKHDFVNIQLQNGGLYACIEAIGELYEKQHEIIDHLNGEA